MVVQVVAYAALRDMLGFRERSLELPVAATVGDAAALLFAGVVPPGVAFAVNDDYARPDRPLADGDLLSLLPPVSGGSDLTRIQSEPIDVAALTDAVSNPGAGAVLSFLGTAREVDGDELVALEYEAHPTLAPRFLTELAEELRTRFGIERAAIVHRTGAVRVGEVSVAIVVASAHRGPGFEALRHAIERIKERAPVWKKEVTRRGGHWIAIEKMEGG